MNDLLLIATHDQLQHAIHDHVTSPDGCSASATYAVVAAVCNLHVAALPEQGPQPWSDCGSCFGEGYIACADDCDGETGPHRHHCHCQCTWCAACEEPLCAGPCPTVRAVAVALGLLPPLPSPVCGAYEPSQRAGWAYRCTEPYDHDGDCRATVDGREVATWPRKGDR